MFDAISYEPLREFARSLGEEDRVALEFAVLAVCGGTCGCAVERNRIPICPKSDLVLYKIIHSGNQMEIAVIEKRFPHKVCINIVDFTTPVRMNKITEVENSTRLDMNIYSAMRTWLKMKIDCRFENGIRINNIA